jgi:hypothetical protein
MADLPELVLESKTQSAETITKIMDDLGYENIETSEQTDRPPAAAAPPGEPSTDSPAPSSESAGEEVPAGGEVEDGTGQAETAAGGEPAQTQEQQQKKGRTARRIERWRSEAETLKAENEELKRKLAAPPAAQPAAEQPAAAAPATEARKPVDDPEPTIEQFDGEDDPYAALITAKARWAVREERRESARQEQQKQATEESTRKAEVDEAARLATDAEQNTIANRWNTSKARALESHPDFDEVFKRADKPPANQVMVNVANDYDEVAELCYWLMTHPDETKRIESQTRLPENFAQLGPRARLRAVAVAENAAREAFDELLPKLAAPSPAQTPGTAPRRETPAAAAPPASSAPVQPPRAKAEPPRPVGHRGGPVTKRYPQDYTQDEMRNLSIEEVRRLRGMQHG